MKLSDHPLIMEEGGTCDEDRAVRLINKQATEIKRLQLLLARLVRLADGVPAYEGMEVFKLSENTNQICGPWKIEKIRRGYVAVKQGPGVVIYQRVSGLYSTREAAEAAEKE